jgi:hypothetical protein
MGHEGAALARRSLTRITRPSRVAAMRPGRWTQSTDFTGTLPAVAGCVPVRVGFFSLSPEISRLLCSGSLRTLSLEDAISGSVSYRRA